MSTFNIAFVCLIGFAVMALVKAPLAVIGCCLSLYLMALEA